MCSTKCCESAASLSASPSRPQSRPPPTPYQSFNPKEGEAGVQRALIFIAHISLDLWASKAKSIHPGNVAICRYLGILREWQGASWPLFTRVVAFQARDLSQI